jgi:hypothetical protein
VTAAVRRKLRELDTGLPFDTETWNSKYLVGKRRKELGIRMPLGAQRVEVLQAALGRTIKLLTFNSGAGLFLGLLAPLVLV